MLGDKKTPLQRRQASGEMNLMEEEIIQNEPIGEKTYNHFTETEEGSKHTTLFVQYILDIHNQYNTQ